MKRFTCTCGHQLFFDSQQCLYCGSVVGVDSQRLEMVQLQPEDGYYVSPGGDGYFLCDNAVLYQNCNWLRPLADGPGLCYACGFNRVVPNLSYPQNKLRWDKLELAKRRLLYTLLALGLPLRAGAFPGLLFDFVEDGRTNPDFAAQVRNTGYLHGVITVNVAEADDVARESERVAVNERYRTLLGHLRHESGHYYLDFVLPHQETSFTALFGDRSLDYRNALDTYYARGAGSDWQARFISAYASAHPLEDWAETWGHYLHITDVLETAVSHGVLPASVTVAGIAERIATWRRLSITLNELNRSIGHRDAYPFVLNDAVAAKLTYVDSMVQYIVQSAAPAGGRAARPDPPGQTGSGSAAT